jgi:predicted metal-dependent phosphoesterase TrpH
MSSDRPRLRADLHVHSYHSGYASHLRFLRTRDCYSDPEAVYRTGKARGMDLVTITDHDSIGGCLEFLDRHPDAPDFFISEEIECLYPGKPLKIHIGAYGITERIHAELQRLRSNVFELVAYLKQQDVCFVLNHPFFFLRSQIPLHVYLDEMLTLFPGVEVRNGAMLAAQNGLVDEVLADRGLRSAITLGGSDAHTLRRVGTTYTETEGRTREDFLANVRAGRARAGGRHGTTWDIAVEIYGVVGCYWQALAGLRRHDLSWARRLVGVGWSVASLPAEFVPIVVAVSQKTGETRRMAAWREALARPSPGHDAEAGFTPRQAGGDLSVSKVSRPDTAS